MNLAESGSLKHVQYFRAPDDRRPVAIFISGQFDEFERFPPFMETEEEIRHVREAYKIADPLLERTTKAHITDNSWPLQIILLERNPGGRPCRIITYRRRRSPSFRHGIKFSFAKVARRGSAFLPGKGRHSAKSSCVRMILFCCWRDTRSNFSNAVRVFLKLSKVRSREPTRVTKSI